MTDQSLSNPEHDQEHPESFLTVEEVLEILRIKRSTFDDWRRKGQAPPLYRLPNRSLRIDRAEFDAWMASRLLSA
ncbi:hypothetical protein GCM10027589_35920 [Actinocorallia lasiicapitis]